MTQTYDIEQLAIAARLVAKECAELGHPHAGVNIMPLRRAKGGKFESAVVARVPVDGVYKMVSSGWVQDELRFSWADTVESEKRHQEILKGIRNEG